MRAEDVSRGSRIAGLTRLRRGLERCHTTYETLRVLHQGFGDPSTTLILVSTRGLGPGKSRVLCAQSGDGPPTVSLEASTRWSECSGGTLSEIIAGNEPRLLQDVDWSSDPQFHEAWAGYASVIAVPLDYEHLPMTWIVLLKKPPGAFTVADLEQHVERLGLIGALLENQVLSSELARANDRIERDAQQLGQLQRALLPASLPRVAGLEIAASYEPSARAGGDLYDFFSLEDGDQNGVAPDTARWCVYIGDSAGHGLAAAFTMAIVQAVLRAHPAGIARPATLLAHANRQLCSKGIDGYFTAFLGFYDPASRRLTYANAGHPPPLLKRSSGSPLCALNEAVNYPLGIEETATFGEAAVQLDRGDMLLLFTDGITEARGPDNALFDISRLMSCFRDAGARPPDVVDSVRKAVRDHECGQDRKDDQTVVAVRVL